MDEFKILVQLFKNDTYLPAITLAGFLFSFTTYDSQYIANAKKVLTSSKNFAIVEMNEREIIKQRFLTIPPPTKGGVL